MPFGEAIDLVHGLADTPGTRTHAELNDWSWPATFTDLAIISHAEWYMNVHRNPKKTGEITYPRPWSDQKPTVVVSDEERADLRARLVASSPFAH